MQRTTEKKWFLKLSVINEFVRVCDVHEGIENDFFQEEKLERICCNRIMNDENLLKLCDFHCSIEFYWSY